MEGGAGVETDSPSSCLNGSAAVAGAALEGASLSEPKSSRFTSGCGAGEGVAFVGVPSRPPSASFVFVAGRGAPLPAPRDVVAAPPPKSDAASFFFSSDTSGSRGRRSGTYGAARASSRGAEEKGAGGGALLEGADVDAADVDGALRTKGDDVSTDLRRHTPSDTEHCELPPAPQICAEAPHASLIMIFRSHLPSQ